MSGLMRSREERDFLRKMEDRGLSEGARHQIISSCFMEVLGDEAATVALSFTGDASDGNLQEFARRAKELFGDTTKLIFQVIVSKSSDPNMAPKQPRQPESL